MAVAVEVNDVSKRFSLDAERVSSLKERAIRRRRKRSTPFWALSDVSLDIEEGETVGLLGHNGSGKSTLLKLVGGIMKPTSGSIRVRGRLASLLELGAGFHPELTGRENVFINGALLGLTKRDLEARFDDIVEFAELEQFIDMQVRNYSSGMFVRLGFAVAVSVDPDVLLVDEVLAVGDENFQRKCLERMHQLQREQRTIVVVSHSPDQLRSICDRVAVLDHGRLVAFGPPGEAIRVFREHLLDTQLQRRASAEARSRAAQDEADAAGAGDEDGEGTGAGMAASPSTASSPPPSPVPTTAAEHGHQQAAKRNLKVRITEVEIEHQNRLARRYLLPGEPLSVRVRFVASEPVEGAVFGLGVVDNRDGRNLFGINTRILDTDVPTLSGPGEVVFDIESVPLLDGTYPITIGIHSQDEGTVYDWSEQQHFFEVMNPDRRAGTVAMPVVIKISTGAGTATAPVGLRPDDDR